MQSKNTKGKTPNKKPRNKSVAEHYNGKEKISQDKDLKILEDD
jgi:hypothetical protein